MSTPLAAPAPDAPPAWTVLCVDDEPNILSSMRRLFRGTGYRLLTADSGTAALALFEQERIDLVISDMRMPGMDGAQLLQQVRARWPQTTRLLLTGYSDLGSTVAAINQGQIHRYITKPWNDDEILVTVGQAFERQALEAEKRRLEALTQRQNAELTELNATLERKVAERTEELSQANERLKKNYFTSIKTFSTLIELRGGPLMGHSRKVADLSRRICQAMKLDETASRDVFIAALLHDIGFIGLSDEVLSKPVPKMTAEELARYRLHPVFGEQALMGLDDMQGAAALIRAHHERPDGRGFPDGLRDGELPVGAQILAIADTYEDLQAGHLSSATLSASEARTMITRGRGSQFDPGVADAFLSLFATAPAPPAHRPLMLRTDELRPGMVLARDFLSAEGVLLLAADHVLTPDLIARIKNLERRSGQSLLMAIRPAQGGQK